ncbi:hypothetical protein GMOD_00009313 [Pyrenophora seminiperda CCB06]|uniref:Myb-like domain-containing protein n=1 Tax=Pyrenophora seminiperda CCB06 TaxID=1302712 RepID=A0A3M7MBN4_9PLEO|nr:hypothetical protein GMOD_00009313 [Pyrenophora seminiperda CCB06]
MAGATPNKKLSGGNQLPFGKKGKDRVGKGRAAVLPLSEASTGEGEEISRPGASGSSAGKGRGKGKGKATTLASNNQASPSRHSAAQKSSSSPLFEPESGYPSRPRPRPLPLSHSKPATSLHYSPYYALQPSTTPTSLTPNDNAIILARAMKAAAMPTALHTTTNATTPTPATIPVSASSSSADLTTITTMRNDQKAKWSDIAAHLNAQCSSSGRAPIHTPSSCYSRYVLSAPILAKPCLEVGFSTKDYMHLRNPHQFYIPPPLATTNPTNPTSTSSTKTPAKPKLKTTLPHLQSRKKAHQELR